MRRALALAAAAAVLTACGASAPGHTAASPSAVASPSCDQQMATWVKKTRAPVAAFNKAEDDAGRAQDAENIPGLRTALEHAGQAATRMEAAAIPRCADPGGFYAKWLDRYVAAGDNARSQGGLSGLELAEAPLNGAPALRRKLNAELNRRTQYSGI